MAHPAFQSAGARPVLMLAVPILIEQLLNLTVALTDTWLANHVPDADVAATAAAVGTIGYIIWFIGLMTSAVGTGATALIARATGARNRRLANSVCGQAVVLAVVLGVLAGTFMSLFPGKVAAFAGLRGDALNYATQYLQILGLALPMSMFMFMGNACLRGAGDTVRPAAVMAAVNATNLVLSICLVYGYGPFPRMGFAGIAIGTTLAYVVGALLVGWVLITARGGIRLHLHRLRLHGETIRRILRIGLPNGAEGILMGVANFAVLIVINRIDPTNVMAAAHINTIRIESISFLPGVAFGIAAAALTGQALGARDPERARKNVYIAYGFAGGAMTLMGLVFVAFPYAVAGLLADNPAVIDWTASCIRIAGLVQFAFAANLIFSGALRGAGDTLATMLINLSSIILIRLFGVLYVGLVLGKGLQAIWMVLAGELLIRAILIYARFASGKWKTARV